MQDSQARVPHQDGHTLICQEVVRQIEQLQRTQALLPGASRRQRLQAICRCVQVPETDGAHASHLLCGHSLPPSTETIMPPPYGTLSLPATKLLMSSFHQVVLSNWFYPTSFFYSTHPSRVKRHKLDFYCACVSTQRVLLNIMFTNI